ncbi:putative nuclease HARBI1 [Dendronephthya gigantea]|uniref:putative nuclease HARBI1 n=1 Tax=Dendronephthya gigantea TaxID=151771 RepID=UPI00106C6B4F|nr:putative nuclease HARBI1 [Dendronephthya gigantea]
MSGKLHLPLDHSQTELTLEVEAEFEWSMSVGYTSLQPHSNKVVINNMANLWLEILQQLDNLQRNNGKENRNYYFNYEIYDEEQFRSRFRLTKNGFREMFDIIEADISAHNERGNPIPAEIKLLLTLRYYATGTFQEAYADLKCVSEAIARLKVHYIKFPAVEMLQQTKLEFWRICSFPNVVGAIDCTHIKIPCPGGENAELFRNRKGFY